MTEVEIKNLPDSEIEITGEIEASIFEQEREKVIKKLSEEVKIDGFRPGHVPEKILINKIGEQAILEEMAEMAIQKVYPEIIKKNEIKAVGYPKVTITKIAKDNPLGFKIKTAVAPEVELPEYKEIAKREGVKKVDEVSVDEKEIDQTLERIRKSRATKDERGKDVLPEVNDEFAKGLGKFKSLKDLRDSLKENILAEKKGKQKEQKRLEIMEEIIKKTKVDVPKVLIESETKRMLEETKANISQTGVKWDDYIRHLNKTEEEMAKEFEVDAVKRVKFGLVLDKLAEVEKVEVPEDELKKESENLVAYYKNFGQNVALEQARSYVHRILRNERVFKILERVKE